MIKRINRAINFIKEINHLTALLFYCCNAQHGSVSLYAAQYKSQILFDLNITHYLSAASFSPSVTLDFTHLFADVHNRDVNESRSRRVSIFFPCSRIKFLEVKCREMTLGHSSFHYML